MARDRGPSDSSAPVDRRRFLAGGLAASLATLAGCAASDSADDSGSTNESDPSETDDPAPPSPDDADSARFRAVTWPMRPDEFDWNPFTSDSPGDRHGMFAQWTQYLVGEDRFHPHLIEDWEHDDGEFVLALSEEFTWANSGDPVTADDLAFQLEVYDAADHLAARFVEGAEASAEFELTISYPSGTNPELVEYTVLPLLADVPPANWADADWADDPTTVDVREPGASGPIVLREITYVASETDVRSGLDEAADHHLASHYNWDGYELSPRGSEWHPFQNPDTDSVCRIPVSESRREQLPESVSEFQIPRGYGLGLWFDHEREPWNHREVRRALLHVVDREDVLSEIGGYPKQIPEVQTGLTAPSVERWLDSTAPEGFTSYDGGAERARELLAEVGYEPGDIEATIASPEFAGWSNAHSVVAEQLRDAGWDVSDDWTREEPADLIAAEGRYVAAYSHKPPIPVPTNWAYAHHPYFALEYLLRGHYEEDGHFANYDPGTVTVDGESIDVASELDQLASTTGREAQRPIVERLARVVNHDVPCAIVMESVGQSFVDTEQFDVPDSSPHLQSHWPQWWLPKVDESLPGRSEPGLLKYDPSGEA